jgi:hypothetical protein
MVAPPGASTAPVGARRESVAVMAFSIPTAESSWTLTVVLSRRPTG